MAGFIALASNYSLQFCKTVKGDIYKRCVRSFSEVSHLIRDILNYLANGLSFVADITWK